MKCPNKLIQGGLAAQREQTILYQKMLPKNHNGEKQAIGGWDDCFSFLVGRQNITNTKKTSPRAAWDINKTKVMS